MATTFVVGDYRYTTFYDDTFVKARVVDKTKASYGAVPSSITYGGKSYPVKDLDYCFSDCRNLTSAPEILGTSTMRGCFMGCVNLVTPPAILRSQDLRRCFDGCASLLTPPEIATNIPNIEMDYCFIDCESLTSAPVIPDNVKSFSYAFLRCNSLTGEITINGNPTPYWNLFVGTQKGIWLTGSSSQLQAYANTANNGNVFVGEIPLDYSLTAERVGSDGGTTLEPEGNWLHLVASISWSNFAANSIDSMVLILNGTSISTTAYTDAAKTEAITLPGWRPAAQAEAHAWVQVDADTQVITFTVSDTYHTGEPITITIPQVFRTIDFLAGGKGIAFGKVAEHEGFECAMDLFVQPWAGFIQMFAGSTPPNGWAFCDGSELLVGDYPELFAAIGNTYGAPSDSDHFVLPNLQGRFPIGADTSYPIGDTGGSEYIQEHIHEFTNPTIPNHRHAPPNSTTPKAFMSMTGSGSTAGLGEMTKVTTTSSSSYVVPRANANTDFQRVEQTANDGGGGVTSGGAVGVVSGLPSGQTTGNQGNLPPYLGINFIIHLGRPTRSI